MIQKMIDAIDGKKPLEDVSIIEVMKTLVLVWAEITSKTVKNCFKKAGFSEIEEDDGIHESNDPFAALEDSIKQLGFLEKISKNLSVDDVDNFVKSLVK